MGEYADQRAHDVTWMTAAEREALATRTRHCEQAQAGYWYCEATPNDPCGPGRHPHDGHVPGQCAA
jgi:hypothetical protein